MQNLHKLNMTSILSAVFVIYCNIYNVNHFSFYLCRNYTGACIHSQGYGLSKNNQQLLIFLQLSVVNSSNLLLAWQLHVLFMNDQLVMESHLDL